MKKILLSSILLLCLTLCACDASPEELLCRHERVVDAAVEATCTESGLTEGSHCDLCGKVLQAQQTLPALGHSPETEGAVQLSCTRWGATGTTHCVRCNLLLEENRFTAPASHSYVQGKCSLCGQREVDFTDIGIYASREGEQYFARITHGEAMSRLYAEMEQVLSDFHKDAEADAYYYQYNEELGDLYTVAVFDYAKYGLSLTEAQTVYALFRKDHPIFYWMSYWLYWNGRSITVTTVEEYAKGADRARYNQMAYSGIAEYVALAEGESSPYKIALIYYDAILARNHYAYNDRGFEESAQWAHSIMGDFRYGKFVCEGYAKLFQLLLNVSGVENMYICGNTPGSHLWNLVRMDDGAWYWFDLTWGDEQADPYSYFCMTDTLLQTHTPTPSMVNGMYVNATLPQRAAGDFAMDSVLELGETFQQDGSEYRLIAADTLQLVQGERPEAGCVVYLGSVYQVA